MVSSNRGHGGGGQKGRAQIDLQPWQPFAHRQHGSGKRAFLSSRAEHGLHVPAGLVSGGLHERIVADDSAEPAVDSADYRQRRQFVSLQQFHHFLSR